MVPASTIICNGIWVMHANPKETCFRALDLSCFIASFAIILFAFIGFFEALPGTFRSGLSQIQLTRLDINQSVNGTEAANATDETT